MSVPVKGELWVDDGAYAALRDRKKSLFCAGVVKVVGDFNAQDAVRICSRYGEEFARGLTNYASADASRIQGKSSKHFRTILGFEGSDEVVHRAKLCLLVAGNDSESDTSGASTPCRDDARSPAPLLGGSDRQLQMPSPGAAHRSGSGGTLLPLHTAGSTASEAGPGEAGLERDMALGNMSEALYQAQAAWPSTASTPDNRDLAFKADDLAAKLAVLRWDLYAID